MMKNNSSILTKYLTRTLSASERAALLQWRNKSAENEQLFTTASKLRLLSKYKEFDNAMETDIALSTLRASISKRSARAKIMHIARYVAAVVVLATIIGYGWHKLRTPDYTSIFVEKGESVRKVQLADGSFVWLRDSSELRIPKSFSPTHRQVSLIGRAFFDVKPDTEHLFTVNSKNIHVNVLGTTFDLLVDERQKNVEAILVTGKIALQDNAGKNILEMNPGEKVSYNTDKNQYTLKQVDTNIITAWYLDQITFEQATLTEIAARISIIYNIHINIQSEKLANRRYRLVINKDESIVDVLNNIHYIAPIKYQITQNEIIITD